MIRIISGNTRKTQHDRLDAMFRLRKKVFHDLLKWDVTIDGDREIDRFDEANPIYVLSYRPGSEHLRGALRLLPTLGPNMLDDVFSDLLGGQPQIRSAAIWESSRFCIDPEISQNRASNQVTVAAAELMCAVGELGLASDLTHIVTVTDVFLERMFRRMGCPGERLGPALKIGSVTAVGLAWEVSEVLLNAMKVVARLDGPVLERPMSVAEVRRSA